MGNKGEEGKKTNMPKKNITMNLQPLAPPMKKGKPRPTLYLELKPEIVVSFDVAGRQRF